MNLFDDVRYTNAPADIEFLDKVYLATASFLWENTADKWKLSALDLDYIATQIQNNIPAGTKHITLDLETADPEGPSMTGTGVHWFCNVDEFDNYSDFELYRDAWVSIINTVKANGDYSVSIYPIPQGLYTEMKDGVSQTEQDILDNRITELAPVLNALDYISPSFYVLDAVDAGGDVDMTKFQNVFGTKMDRLKAISGKPVTPYLWAQFHTSVAQPVSVQGDMIKDADWQAILDYLLGKSNFAGAIFWGSSTKDWVTDGHNWYKDVLSKMVKKDYKVELEGSEVASFFNLEDAQADLESRKAAMTTGQTIEIHQCDHSQLYKKTGCVISDTFVKP